MFDGYLVLKQLIESEINKDKILGNHTYIILSNQT